ncbi:hypothetical protein HAX54_036759, partial [Datura stramonium]|nr:hypothetical protein [Datura stramonium]
GIGFCLATVCCSDCLLAAFDPLWQSVTRCNESATARHISLQQELTKQKAVS